MGTVHHPRPVPVRPDRWQPADVTIDAGLRVACEQVAVDADQQENGYWVAGLLILSVLGIGVLRAGAGAQTALLLLGVTAGIAVLVRCLATTPAGAQMPPMQQAVAGIGGAGVLPAGYLVRADLWHPVMQQYVAGYSDMHLHVAAQLCREYPGSVHGLLRFVAGTTTQLGLTGRDDVATETSVEQIVTAAQRSLRAGSLAIRDH